MRTIYIFILFNLFTWTTMSAQWTGRDSIWIQNTITNGGEYRLNQETLDAIRRGTFLNSEAIRSELLPTPSELPIIKDFDNLNRRESLFYDLNILHLSPSEVLLYRYEPDSILFINSAVLKDKDDILVTGYFKFPHSNVVVTAPSADLLLPDIEFVNGEWQGNLRARTFVTFSAEDALEDIFEPSEHQKRKNRKDADAWKFYNMEDMNE